MDADSTSRTLRDEIGTLHYHEAGPVEGGGQVPLVLLHGSGPGVSGWSNFGGNLPAFARHFRTLVPDLPGFGRSEAADGLPMMTAQDGIRRLLDHLGIARAHVIGNSFGGIVGSQFAAASPDRVERLVTIGGFVQTIYAPFPAEGILRLVEFVEDPTREKLVTWMRSMVHDPAVITEELIETRYRTALDPAIMATAKQMYSRASIEHLVKIMRGPDGMMTMVHLPRIQAPTLVTWGRDDRVNPLDGSMLPMRFIPDCELHVFPNCGHWAMIERKAEFESTVLAFLMRE